MKPIRYEYDVLEVAKEAGVSKTTAYKYLAELYYRGLDLTKKEKYSLAISSMFRIRGILSRSKTRNFGKAVQKYLDQLKKENDSKEYTALGQTNFFEGIQSPIDMTPEKAINFIKATFEKVERLEAENKELRDRLKEPRVIVVAKEKPQKIKEILENIIYAIDDLEVI